MGKELRDYGIVFRSVVGNPLISKGARLLYALLCTWRNKETNICYPGTALLTTSLSSSRQQINIWFIELEQFKAVQRYTRIDNLSGKKIRTIYITDENYDK